LKKIVDEKGKLFGIINVVDLIVLLVILAVAAAVLWKLFGNTVTSAMSGKTEFTYVVKCTEVDASLKEILEEQKLPQQLMSSGSYVNGSLTKVEFAPHMVTALQQDGTVMTYEDEGTVDAYFTITASVDSRTLTFPVGSQEVRVGKEHIVKTRYIELEGFILSVDIAE
jgi:hypothetical protein